MPNQPDSQNSFVFRISDLYRLMRQTFAQQDGPEVTRAQAKVLFAVWRNPGITQQALATRLDIATMSVCRQVDALETKCLIERRTDQADRRVRRLYITERALPLVDDVLVLINEISDQFLAPLNAEERKMLDQLLGRIIAEASGNRTGTEP